MPRPIQLNPRKIRLIPMNSPITQRAEAGHCEYRIPQFATVLPTTRPASRLDPATPQEQIDLRPVHVIKAVKELTSRVDAGAIRLAIRHRDEIARIVSLSGGDEDFLELLDITV